MHLFLVSKQPGLIFEEASTSQKLFFLILFLSLCDFGLVNSFKEQQNKNLCWKKPKTAYFYLHHELRSTFIEFLDLGTSNGQFALVGGLLPTKLKIHYFVCDFSLAISMIQRNTTMFLTANPQDQKIYFVKGNLKTIGENDPRLFFYYLDWMSDKNIIKNKLTGLFLRFKELRSSYVHVMELSDPRLATDVTMNRYLIYNNKQQI